MAPQVKDQPSPPDIPPEIETIDASQIEPLRTCFQKNQEEIAVEFMNRLVENERVSASLEESPLTPKDIENTVHAFIDDLLRDSYTAKTASSRIEFGERWAAAPLPLLPLIGAFDAYTSIIKPDLRREIERTVSDADNQTQHAGSIVATAFDRIEALEHLKGLECRAVTKGYVQANSATDTEEISSGDLAQKIEEMGTRHLRSAKASATVVNRASDDVREVVTEQTNRSNTIANDIARMSDTVEQVASNASQVETVASEAESKALDGQQAAEQAIDVMENIETASETVVDDIEELETRVGDIDEVVEIINNIAQQTNMLALNANIEAARAGEAGEGFAVVAQEVKKLAAKSKEHAEKIEALVEEIQGMTAQTVDSLHNTNDEVTSGVEQVEETLVQLEGIVRAVTKAAEGVGEIADATDEQAERADSVATVVEDVADGAKNVQSEINKIAAANEEQANKLDDLSLAIEDLVDELQSHNSSTTQDAHVQE